MAHLTNDLLPEELERLTTSDDQDVIDREIKRAIAALNESWRIRFGIFRRGLSAYEKVGPELVSRALNLVNFLPGCTTGGVGEFAEHHVYGQIPRSFTFHKGQIGGWREHFSPEHEEIFNERYGKLLELYSYA